MYLNKTKGKTGHEEFSHTDLQTLIPILIFEPCNCFELTLSWEVICHPLEGKHGKRQRDGNSYLVMVYKL